MSNKQLKPFVEVLQALYQLCVEGHTGTMYIFTDQEHGAVFAMANGKIIDYFYRSTRGPQSLPLIKQIKAARHFFKVDPKLETHTSKFKLSNEEIFEKMGLDVSKININKKTTGRKKVLAVEDSAIARKAIVQALNNYDLDVVEAKDGFEALGKLGEEIPDLVLLDLILPKMDGYEVLAAMKKDNNYKNIPVIVLTSRDTLFDKLKGKVSGIDEYLTKPFQPHELMKVINKYLM